MALASKRAKSTTKAQTETDVVNSSAVFLSLSPLILFQTGPSLERILEDVLHEITSYLPTLTIHQVLRGGSQNPPVISTDSLVRTPTLPALSQTSRSRCLAMARQRIEVCSVRLPEHNASLYSVISKATQARIRVLNACPHLLPLIQFIRAING